MQRKKTFCSSDAGESIFCVHVSLHDGCLSLSRELSKKVLDEQGQPIIGANIVEKEPNGTITGCRW